MKVGDLLQRLYDRLLSWGMEPTAAATLTVVAWQGEGGLEELDSVTVAMADVRHTITPFKPGKVFSQLRNREISEEHVMAWALAPSDIVEGDVFFVAKGKAIGIVKYLGNDGQAWMVTMRSGKTTIATKPVDDPILLLAAFEQFRRELCG